MALVSTGRCTQSKMRARAGGCATGDIVAARALCWRALAAFREAGDPSGSARSLTDLGYIDFEQANHLSGRAAFREAMESLRGWVIGAG
jgi:hypothetical protein